MQQLLPRRTLKPPDKNTPLHLLNEKHRKHLQGKRLVVLGISDDYAYMDG
jgi:predicted protein tyrosine phosphatase